MCVCVTSDYCLMLRRSANGKHVVPTDLSPNDYMARCAENASTISNRGSHKTANIHSMRHVLFNVLLPIILRQLITN